VPQTGLDAHDVATKNGAPWADYLAERLGRAEQLLEERASEGRRKGLRVTPLLIHGHADAAIVSTAHSRNADLVVVGSHRRTANERWLLGSVAERVVRLSERNVLVARSATPPRHQLDRILVAVDYSPTSVRGLATALSLSAESAAITVLHCWRTPVHYGLAPPDEVRASLRERAHEHGNQLLAQLSSGRRPQLVIVDADPVDGILSALESHDILVIGSHGRRGVKRMLLGSVAEKVVRHATRSVLVVHGVAGEDD
jgi:nucleotide-binding universal stress UspA family protein